MGKGGDYERSISKELTFWLTGKNKPYRFWRNDASGGLATVHIENNHMTGDIKSVHPDSEFFTDIFSIELKTGYPKTSFFQHFSSVKFGIKEFWLQANNDAVKANKQPMLIYRKKHRRDIVGINEEIQKKLKKCLVNLNHIVVSWGKENIDDCYLYDKIDFFENIKPDDIRRLTDENI